MLNPNHWFIAFDRGPELRIGTWSANNRHRAGTRHLCGQKCLHKLVDDFMARALSVRSSTEDAALPIGSRTQIDAGLTSRKAFAFQPAPIIGSYVEEVESSARLLSPGPGERALSPHRLRAEAWKRERDRQRASEPAEPRRSIA